MRKEKPKSTKLTHSEFNEKLKALRITLDKLAEEVAIQKLESNIDEDCI